MKLDKSKTTILALVALVIVCGGSFLGVKALNNRTVQKAPVVITTGNFTTTEPATSLITTAPMPETDAPSTLPIESLKNDETTTTGTSSVNPFTTFPNASSSATKDSLETTKESLETTAELSTVAETTAAQSVTEKETEAQQVIKSAAVFSDGFLSYMFDPKGDYYFTKDDPWQRNFGFNELYDVGAAFIVFYYDTVRCKFQYDNKDWLIQLWKGQYGFVFLGAEIGVYNKPTTRTVEHYDAASDEDALMMSMTFYRKGEELLTRDYAKYWWCTGFVPGKLDKFSDRSELSIKCRITMKDYKMLIGMAGALKENGFELNKDYTTSGLDVFISW